METNILMESGTNELEILEFTIGKNHYGINVAKIKEIVTSSDVTPIPNAHPAIEGVFMPRDTMITVINLANVIKLEEIQETARDMFIITNFNKLNVAFHVHTVVGIHRVSWADIVTPDTTVNSPETAVATGIIKINGKLIVILDFEKIVSDISPETGLKMSDIEKLGVRSRNTSPIVVAEDSPLLMKLITESIKKSGYQNVSAFKNGAEAWEYISKTAEEGELDSKIKCIITDIEMPLMDGHRLTKLVKTDERLKHIPVVIFSSLINEEMRRKGALLGADVQLSKPEIGSLVSEIDKLLNFNS